MKAYILFFLSGISLLSFGQTVSIDTVSQSKKAMMVSLESALAVSGPLITLGFISNANSSIVNKYEFKEGRDKNFSSFHTRIDDFIQYAPIASIYGLGAMGVRARHNSRFQTMVLLKSELLMTAIVTPLKRITHVIRPDSSAYSSFPSGHVAQAFLGAEMLRKEYGRDHPWIAIGGYLTATSVGALRILNNKHWLSDVIAGAGIGILSVNIIYCTQKINTKVKRMTFTPTYSDAQPGFYLAYAL